MKGTRSTQLEVIPPEPEMTLVDAAPEVDPGPELLTHAEAREFEKFQRAQPRCAATSLTLSSANLTRAHEVRVAFEQADEDSDIGARLLEEFVSGEAALVLELQDVEGALVSLLGQTITDPARAAAVTGMLRDVVGVHNSLRKRLETSLGAAENLRAQRRFLSAPRGRSGD